MEYPEPEIDERMEHVLRSIDLHTRRFGTWLESTRVLQQDTFDTDPAALEGDAFADYVTWNGMAATVELAELLQHLPWKPWVRDRGRPGAKSRDRAVEELVDLVHFVGNLAVALRVTDQELNERYLAKQWENRDRQRALNKVQNEHSLTSVRAWQERQRKTHE